MFQELHGFVSANELIIVITNKRICIDNHLQVISDFFLSIFLIEYSRRNYEIHLSGCTQDVAITIRFLKMLPVNVSGTILDNDVDNHVAAFIHIYFILVGNTEYITSVALVDVMVLARLFEIFGQLGTHRQQLKTFLLIILLSHHAGYVSIMQIYVLSVVEHQGV